MQHFKGITKLGGIGYDALIIRNTAFNWISEQTGTRGCLSIF